MGLTPDMTVSYTAGAYGSDEINALRSRLSSLSRLELDPVSLPHSAGICELWTTLVIERPAVVRGALASEVHETLSAIFRELGDWWRACAQDRAVAPEVTLVHLEFLDVHITFDSEAAQGTYLGRAEIRAIPGILRDVARRLAPLASLESPPSVCVGIRKDVTESGSAQCFAGRYWQIGPQDEDAAQIYDSWRERFYRRSD